MAGRKGFGEELELIRRYSELTEPFFQRLKERLESDDKKDQDFALSLLNGVFTKMIPQQLNGEITNKNLNTDIECSPEEHESIKQAILKSMESSGSQE